MINELRMPLKIKHNCQFYHNSNAYLLRRTAVIFIKRSTLNDFGTLNHFGKEIKCDE